MAEEQSFQLTDLRDVLRRRGPTALAIAFGVVLGSILLASWLPSRYEAFATLLVEPQTISKKLLEANVEESDLNKRLHLMTMQILSRPRLSKIIDELKLYPDLSKEETREEVIDHMRSQIRVEPVLPELDEAQRARRATDYEINTFRLFFDHENADTASAVANRIANDFIDQHLKERVQVSGDTSDFIESELSRLNSQIQEVEQKIAQVKLENPGMLPEDLDANQRLLERTLDNLRLAQREFTQAQSDQAFYRQQALVAAAPVGMMNESDPNQRLKLLELQLANYRSRGFTDKHPDVIAAQIEIAEIRKSISAGEADNGPALSVAQQNAEAEARRAELRIAAAQEAVKSLQAQADEIQKHLAETPRVAERLAALDREHQHLFDSFQQFSAKRLEAGVAANMELRQKGEQVRVLEAAFPPPVPASPNRPLIISLGALFGLTLGAGIAILLEGTDASFHQPQTLQSAVRIPVLSSIPAIILDADRAMQRRRRLRIGLASAAITAVVLATSGAGYVYQNVIREKSLEPPAAAAATPPQSVPTTRPAAPAAPATAAPLPSVITPSPETPSVGPSN